MRVLGTGVGGVFRAPVAVRSRRLAETACDVAPRFDLASRPVDRQRRRDVTELEVDLQRRFIERAVEVFVRAQRLQLGSPQQPLRTLRIVDRLLAESVADQRQQTLLPIPERDGEHANQSPKRVFNAPPSKTFEHHLRVGRAAPCHARQFGAQLAVVVDLAVVGDDEAAVRGHHRLVPRR